MLAARFTWPTLTRYALAISAFLCAIVPESMRCFYRQHFGADDTLSLQLQYLFDPGKLAFAAYIDDPVPAKPFQAAPADVSRFTFDVPLDGKAYGADLQQTEIRLHLDELPSPSSLTEGEVVHLHGSLEITAFSLPPSQSNDEQDVEPLELASSSVLVDCNPVFGYVEAVE